MRALPRLTWYALAVLLILALVTAGCGGSSGSNDNQRVFYIGGIPDQEVAVLEQRFNGIAAYLSRETGLNVQYIPTVDYPAVVTGFRLGDIQMAWYGGLTGVQARLAVPNAQAIAQRPRDAQFTSVFVANPALNIRSLEDLRGKRFTFGSESSTSGHLMPRYFLSQTGINPETDFAGGPSYSGSHDSTWQLVAAGSFDAGVLSEEVWEARLASGAIDRSKVDAFYITPPYYDYHWVIRGDVDQIYGEGTMERVKAALLALSADDSEEERRIAESFQTDTFIETSNENYQAIEQVATGLGIINP